MSVCFPGLADPGTAARESQTSKPLLAALGHNEVQHQPRPATPASILTFPSFNNQLYSYPCDELELPSPPPRDVSSLDHDVISSVMKPSKSILKGDPPPYHSHHTVVLQGTGNQGYDFTSSSPISPDDFIANPSSSIKGPDLPLPRPLPVCRKPHPPNITCKTCNIVRKSNRQNAARMVRRANSSGCQHKRVSVPLVSNSVNETQDDSPSILAQLRREWQLGEGGSQLDTNIPSSGCNTLPRSLVNIYKESELACKSDLQNQHVIKSAVHDNKEQLTRQDSDQPSVCCHSNYKATQITEQKPKPENEASSHPLKHRHSAVAHLAHLKDLASKLISQSGNSSTESKRSNSFKFKSTEKDKSAEDNNKKIQQEIAPVKTEILSDDLNSPKNEGVSNKVEDDYYNYKLDADDDNTDSLNEKNYKTSKENFELIILEDTDQIKMSREIKEITNLVDLI